MKAGRGSGFKFPLTAPASCLRLRSGRATPADDTNTSGAHQDLPQDLDTAMRPLSDKIGAARHNTPSPNNASSARFEVSDVDAAASGRSQVPPLSPGAASSLISASGPLSRVDPAVMPGDTFGLQLSRLPSVPRIPTDPALVSAALRSQTPDSVDSYRKNPLEEFSDEDSDDNLPDLDEFARAASRQSSPSYDANDPFPGWPNELRRIAAAS